MEFEVIFLKSETAGRIERTRSPGATRHGRPDARHGAAKGEIPERFHERILRLVLKGEKAHDTASSAEKTALFAPMLTGGRVACQLTAEVTRSWKMVEGE
jgi:hypothetical protein